MAYKDKEKKLDYERKWKKKLRSTPEGRLKNIESVKKWRNNNLQKSRDNNKRWAKNNREKINKRLRDRYKEDSIWRLQLLLRSRMKDYDFKSTFNGDGYDDFIGCSLNDLKIHIESLFKPGMTWDNQGEWHIDHIVPLSLLAKIHKDNLEDFFDLYLKDAFHYTNLRPEWKDDNLKRGNRWVLIKPN